MQFCSRASLWFWLNFVVLYVLRPRKNASIWSRWRSLAWRSRESSMKRPEGPRSSSYSHEHCSSNDDFFFPSKFRDMMMFYITCDPCWLRAAAGQVQGCSWKEGRPGCLSDREKDCRSHLHTLRYVTQSLKSTSRTWRSVLNKRAIVVNTTCKAVNNHQQVQLVFLRPLVPFTSNAADLVFIV